VQAILISVGDELTGGETVDTNSAWISGQLKRLGIATAAHITVGDDRQRLGKVIQEACEQVAAVIVTGGLGPTDDDLTRFAVADILGVELQLHEGWLAEIQKFFDRLGRPMAERNRVQAMIPQGCTVLFNPVGTACGFATKLENATAFFLPGVPREMKYLCQEAVFPALKKLLRQGGDYGEIIVSRELHCFGAGESDVAVLIGDAMERGRNPLVNCTVAQGIVTLRIHATAASEAACLAMIEPVEKKLRQCLGYLLYGQDDETLAQVTTAALAARRQTAATAESCSGGLIAKMITDCPGASAFFLGGVVAYSNELKVKLLGIDPEVIGSYGAVSEEVAKAMARQVRLYCRSDYGLACTGIAGPSGGTPEKPVGLVYVALAKEGETIVKKGLFPGDREMVRLRTALTALNLLRLNMD